MSINEVLMSRSEGKCELCSSDSELQSFLLPPNQEQSADLAIFICSKCQSDIDTNEKLDENHWRCLASSMWSEHIPVQIASYRMLYKLKHETWAADLLEQIYLDDEALKYAKSVLSSDEDDSLVVKDSNGSILMEGDSVTLIKDLNVKGANFTAKRGTMVRNISLTNDPKHIEGKVNGVQIVLVTAFLKKV